MHLKASFSGLLMTAALMTAAFVSGCDDAAGRFVVVTGSDTGVYYQVGQAIDAMARRNENNLRLSVRTSGGSVDNARQMGAGHADFAMIQNDIAAYAVEGKQMFEGQAIDNIRGVAAFYPEHVHLIARADSGITTVADLAGKSVAIGDAASGTEANALQILEAYGLSEQSLGTTERLDASQSAGRIQDGHLQAMFYTVGVGAAAIQELATQVDLVFIPVEGQEAESLMEQHAFYSQATIPAGAYGDNRPATDVQTVAVTAMLVAREEVPAEAVEAVLASIFDNLDAFRGRHARLQDVTVEQARALATIPLHEGAEAFYEQAAAPAPE